MDAWIKQPWTRRWWRMPGEMLLSESIAGRQVEVQLSWCQPNEWGLKLAFDDGHRAPSAGLGSFLLDAEEFLDLDAVPKPVVIALMNQLKIRERGIRDAPKLASDPVLTAITEVLPKEEWTTGRRLRKLTGLDVETFNRHLGRLVPRYVRCDAVDENDKYSLTLPGLLAMDARLGSIALMERIYQTIARCYERNEDAEIFENADLVASGVNNVDIPLARTIARICLLAGDGADLSETDLRIPADREAIAAQAKEKEGLCFLDYLYHAAIEKQRNVHFASIDHGCKHPSGPSETARQPTTCRRAFWRTPFLQEGFEE